MTLMSVPRLPQGRYWAVMSVTELSRWSNGVEQMSLRFIEPLKSNLLWRYPVPNLANGFRDLWQQTRQIILKATYYDQLFPLFGARLAKHRKIWPASMYALWMQSSQSAANLSGIQNPSWTLPSSSDAFIACSKKLLIRQAMADSGWQITPKHSGSSIKKVRAFGSCPGL